MQTAYIRFEAPQNLAKKQKKNIFYRALTRMAKIVLFRLFPKANPDFDERIDDVKTWLVECDLATGVPQREIGLDSNGNPIVKMPDHRNYGYWTDNNLFLDDFKEHFAISQITMDTFDKYWAYK